MAAGSGRTGAPERARVWTAASVAFAACGVAPWAGLTAWTGPSGATEVCGVGAVTPSAATMAGAAVWIAEGVVAIEMGMTASDLKLSIHAHPTLSETLMEAAEVFFGQATHVYKPKKKS